MIATANENTILIPGGAVLENVFAGLIYQLGLASDKIGNATDLDHAILRPGPLAWPLERFDSIRSLLDEIGWQTTTDVQVSGERWPLIAEALREEARLLADMARDNRKDHEDATADRQRNEHEAVIDYLIGDGEGGRA
jgi:hypothetical protein